VTWQRETFAVEPKDRVAQLTNLSFDPVLRDIFLPLTSGATLCLPDESVAEGTLAWLARAQVSLVHAVPSMAQFWLSQVPPATASCESLRQVFFAGEPLTDVLVRRWREVCPASEVVNLYGPTETTLAKCCYRVPPEVPPGIQSVGFPLPQTQALVVSARGQLCGIGELGEIVFRTPFRTLGYLKSAAQASENFVKNPWRDDDRDVLYYTGDLGRYGADGSLEICGRADAQLKIHGVRVEPGEVTVVLAQHPAVTACAVTGGKDDRGQTALVAYVVPAEGRAVTVPELKSYLASRLPTAMVPSGVVFLERLPLTPNGKLDRKALPAPAWSGGGRAVYEPPRTTTEKLLAGIVGELLGVERVGRDDNFFDLGGHSLLVMQVVSRVERAFGIAIPVRSFFELSTISAMAAEIERRGSQARAVLPSSEIEEREEFAL
jgi:acyl-coenzyme A synthetase/AMP-(fatty) acid ligase/acyl carrier protein